MTTISVCMIVKNEERRLAGCLDCLTEIADEIVIVDTGSCDRTKEIAAKYTDKIYDFKWVNDFSAARNFAFSLCTCDYIYSADADELIDSVNIRAFRNLKDAIVPEIEIVQMHYLNPEDCNMAYNDLDELRPKLFKRLRTFRWIDPIHETVQTEPLVFDSDICIIHKPECNHSGRDFRAFLEVLRKNNGKMSDRLFSMYAKELFFNGTKDDFKDARPYFDERTGSQDLFTYLEALCVLVKYSLDWEEDRELLEFERDFRSFEVKPAEIDFMLGCFFEKNGDPDKATEYYEMSKSDENFVCVKYKA